MAVVKIPAEQTTLTDPREVTAFLAAKGIEYEKWTPSRELPPGASADEVLEAYGEQVAALKARGGYVTADVIDVTADTPNLDMMLAKFSREHWHDEDEVRFIIEGRAARITGSISVPSGAFAPSGCSRTPRAGRRTTPTAASIAGSSRSASVRSTSGR
jgi:hypothetical protein